MENKGKKNDEGKAMMGLIPLSLLQGVARVYEYGLKKYGLNNWTRFESNEEERRRFTSALLRHLSEYQTDSNAIDEESGLPHADHIAWNAIMLIYLKENGE